MSRAHITKHIGVQVGSNSILDEGPEFVLDHLQSTCRANAVHVYANTMHYQATALHRGGGTWPDHGKPVPAPHRPLTPSWTRIDERYYDQTSIRFKPDPALEGTGVDVFDLLEGPARARGVSVFARWCDWARCHPQWPGMERVLSVNAAGAVNPYACHNHPDWKAFWVAEVRNALGLHPWLGGILYCPERVGPLMVAMGGNSADCFCQHCLARGVAAGVDAEAARVGLQEIAAWARGPSSPERYVGFLRLLLRHPAALAWDKLWYDAQRELWWSLHATAKAMSPSYQVGFHIWQMAVFNPWFRAAMDMSAMVGHADFLKPVVYHECAGARMQGFVGSAWQKHMLADLSPSLACDVLHAWCGRDPVKEPSYADQQGAIVPAFSPESVEREVRAYRRATGDAVPVFAGIATDVPGPGVPPSTPTAVAAGAEAAFRGGAQGLIISREYDEMELSNLTAIGDAVARDAVRAQAASG
jgi:hypothetical protein